MPPPDVAILVFLAWLDRVPCSPSSSNTTPARASRRRVEVLRRSLAQVLVTDEVVGVAGDVQQMARTQRSKYFSQNESEVASSRQVFAEPAVEIDRTQVFAEIEVADRTHVFRRRTGPPRGCGGSCGAASDRESACCIGSRNGTTTVDAGKIDATAADPRDVEVVFRNVTRFGRIFAAAQQDDFAQVVLPGKNRRTPRRASSSCQGTMRSLR